MLRQLLCPRHIAMFGGASAQEAIRQCLKLGFQGQLWPVHPKHSEIEGLRCYPSVEALPAAPDASFIAVHADATIEIVRQLRARKAGGVVCYASGFSEVGPVGAQKQQALQQAAGGLQGMPLLGPNCYGMLNYLDGVAMWPDQHGGQRLAADARGVAIITQSGNIAVNLTMQQRGLPLAYMITFGNQAGCGFAEVIMALLQDPRVSAIGMHMEGLGDVSAFSKAAIQALRQGVPLVALKAGRSNQGAEMALSHTSSLSGSDQLHDALFARYGVARVDEPTALIETLKLLHTTGKLQGRRIVSASCSGGEASLMADLAEQHQLTMPALPAPVQTELEQVLGDKVHVANPLDYHTYIWGDAAASQACFTALLRCDFDLHLLLLDYPRLDRCSADSWALTLQAFEAAKHSTGSQACVLSSMPENFPEEVALRLIGQGIAPMMGLNDAVKAIAQAAKIGEVTLETLTALPVVQARQEGELIVLNEVQSKQRLASYGLPIPAGQVFAPEQLEDIANHLTYPVVLKAVSATLAHKTEAGAVKLNLQNAKQLGDALLSMRGLASEFLVEPMMQGAVAELIVGLQRDPQFGLTLTVGAGGVWVEIFADSQTLLLPATDQEIQDALLRLRMAPLLQGYRGKPKADMPATIAAIQAICRFANDHANTLQELDVNPLLLLSKGVVAVDALIRMVQIEEPMSAHCAR